MKCAGMQCFTAVVQELRRLMHFFFIFFYFVCFVCSLHLMLGNTCRTWQCLSRDSTVMRLQRVRMVGKVNSFFLVRCILREKRQNHHVMQVFLTHCNCRLPGSWRSSCCTIPVSLVGNNLYDYFKTRSKLLFLAVYKCIIIFLFLIFFT